MPSARFLLHLPSRSDLLLAVTWFLLGTLFYVTGLPALFSEYAPSAPLWQRLVLLGLGCLVVLERRRAPLLGLGVAVVLVIADWFVGSSLPILLILTEAIYNAVRRGSPRLSRAVLAGATVATILVTVAAGVVTGDWRITVPVILQAGLFLLLPVWWAMEVRQHRELVEAERLAAAQQDRITELDRSAAVSAERVRMARDLHDVVAGQLSVIAVQSAAALSIADTDPGTARSVLALVQDNSTQSLAEMRAMLDLLHTEESGPPTAPARLAVLERLLDSARAAGLQVTVQVELTEELPSAIDLTAYRIVQEALTNAVQHAAGSRASVTLRRGENALIVEVVNDLTAPVAEAPGTALAGMRERVAALGGTVSAGLAGGRWRVRAVLPTGVSEG